MSQTGRPVKQNLLVARAWAAAPLMFGGAAVDGGSGASSVPLPRTLRPGDAFFQL